MNNGHANAALLIVDLLTGARSFSQEKVVDALQLLADGAGKKLMTTRRPVEVRDAAVRLHELVVGSKYEWAVACCNPNHPDYGTPYLTGDPERLREFVESGEAADCRELVRRPVGLYRRPEVAS